MNYIKLFEDGTSEAVDVKPSWGMYEKEHALDNREVYIDGNWYSTTGGELVTNGDFSTSIGAEWVGNISIVSSMGKIVESGNMARLTVSDLTPNEINVIIINIVNIVSGTPRMYIRDNKINEIYITNLTVGNHLIEIVPKFTTVDLSFYFNGGGTGEYYIDNISVYKKEPTIDTLQPPHTYLSNKGKLAGIEVANGIPVDIHYDELAPTLVEDTIKTSNLVVTDGFDLGQSWVDVKSERAVGVTYTNDTGKPIYIYFYAYNGSIAGAVGLRYTIAINEIGITYGTYTGYATLGFLAKVPTGATYQIGQEGSSPQYFLWKELR